MKLALIGRSMISPFGFAIRPRMPASWRICLNDPRAPGVRHHEDGVQLVERALHGLGNRVGRLRPDVDDRLVALLLGDEAALVLGGHLGDALLVALEDLFLVRRDHDVVLRDRHAGARRVLEAERLDRVEHVGDGVGAVDVDEVADEVAELLLRERLVDELVRPALPDGPTAASASACATSQLKITRPALVVMIVAVPEVLDRLLQRELLRLERELDLVLRSGGRVRLVEVEARRGPCRSRSGSTAPSTMSCVGVASTRPLAGERMLFDESMRIRASAWASAESGRWTAIWSPSKSALNA